jgi:hypothetical protein
MPLPVPNLDDRTFEQLVTEGRSLIPRYSRAWTNHNPSDPGITLLELFAYLTETAIFQLNQVPDASIERFLRLIGVCQGKESLDQTLARALGGIGRATRAVTTADFEALAREAAEQAGTPLARTAFTLYRDLVCAPFGDPARAPLAALIIVVPDQSDSPTPRPTTELIQAIFYRLKPHVPLTTRVHVIGPTYVQVNVAVTLVRKPGSGLTARDIEHAIRGFFHPLRGGPEGQGWPFGRTVYYSEMYQRLESLARLDHVETLKLGGPEELPAPPSADRTGIPIPPQALVCAGKVQVEVTD